MNEATLDKLFETVYASNPNTDVEGTWIAGLAIAAVALRRSDEFTRERLLRNVERELRDDLASINFLRPKTRPPDDTKGHQ